ncbi:unnamed protein product [Caenorhabditis nigoni]
MNDLVINLKTKPDISRPQWDQRTYYGRVRHFFTLTNPLTLFSSEARQEKCREIVTNYRKGIISDQLTVNELWKAKALYDATYHPDSGEKMFFLGRMSAQMPGNMLINGMLLSLYRTFPGVVFSHWINQSFNAVVNYTNRSGNVKTSNERLLLSYLCATGGAMSAALALNAMVKNKNSVAARLVPFAAVAMANCINIPMIRSNEVTEGLELRDERGELVGRSRKMAILSIAQVTMSRIFMAMPDMVMTPIIMNRITRTAYYRTRPWMQKYSEYPIQTMLAGMALFFTTPMCCALFPQKTAIEVTKLEPASQNEIFSRADAPEVIKIGISAAETTQTGSVGWSVCGGAVPLAIERLRQFGFVENFDFEYIVEYTECDLGSVVRAGMKFIKEDKVDVIIGPPCAQALRTMSILASNSRKPVLGYGFVSDSDLSDVIRFPYLTTVLPNSQIVMTDVESTLSDPEADFDVNIVIKAEIYLNDNQTTDIVLQSVKSRARISQSGLTPIWESFSEGTDGLEPIAKQAAQRMLVLDVNSEVIDKAYLHYMQNNIIKAVREAPMNCSTVACMSANNTVMGAYARHLFDVVYLYGVALTHTNSTDSEVYSNVDFIVPQFITSFQGMTGEVKISTNLTRMSIFQLYGLNAQYDQVTYINFTFLNEKMNVSLFYKDEGPTVWHFYSNHRPLDTPICGFLGKSCPVSFFQQYQLLIIVAIIVIVLMLITLIIGCCYIASSRRAEQLRINSEWQIPFLSLLEPENRKNGHHTSKRSLQSAQTGESKTTSISDFCENYTIMIYEKDLVLTAKFQYRNLTKSDMEKFVKLRKLEHENLNKFIGLSIDGSQFISVTKLCSRGSLQDILSRGNFSMDYFFMFCIIKDIAEGLNYLHKSFLRLHGNLRSATCLVNDSWQVKLAEFGMENLVENETPPKKRLLWVAPEVLRGSLTVSQMDPSADVYSFAIVASEILTKKEAWDFLDRKEDSEEIVYMVKKGGVFSIRPELVTDIPDVNPDLIRLVKDCWAEDPEDRPNSEGICGTLKSLKPKSKSNLMDHVFNMLEEYTQTLEVEVEERTKELTLEKKKADILLSRMLPRQVAERLKAGQTVEPEGFDSVTVFFSDVVKFTQLSQKCSPFQVVNLLNDLYSNFDTIIEEHGVYKVESIGDGYLCVSGLPTRNGYAHIKQIVDMSLQFMEYCRKFKIPHLPREQVELRIGVNSGPCVAGVVGLSMPRYCLFGDTVNTASRMESNGKASQIHMSEAAHSLLTSHYPHQYETSSRGEVIIKGKGVMETFWVHGKLEEDVVERISIRETPEIKLEPILKKEIRSISSHGSRPSSIIDPLQDHRKFKKDQPIYFV